MAVRQEGPVHAPDAKRPLLLNTGRSRDQWHTMTRTGGVPRLMTHAPEPVLDLAPADAAGLADGDLVAVESRFGKAFARVRVTDAQRPGEAFLPMHWSGHFAARSGAGPVSSPIADAHSGQPELKAVPVRMARVALGWHGLLITARDLRPTGLLHWSRARVEGGWAYEMMGAEPPADGVLLARALLAPASRANLIDYADKRAGTWRAAALDEGGPSECRPAWHPVDRDSTRVGKGAPAARLEGAARHRLDASAPASAARVGGRVDAK